MMIESRRRFLKTVAFSTAATPILLNVNVDYCEAATSTGIDWSMGFPKGSILLNRNENPIGPSRKAVEAASDGASRSARYADPDFIRSLLADHHDIDKEWILVGTGSGELLKLAPLVFARTGNVVSTLESYRALPVYAQNLGASVKWVNLLKDKSFAYDLEGLLASVDQDTGILFVVTPNNPTGTTLNYDELQYIADGLPERTLFVIDEAYIHFQPDGKSGIDLLKAGYENVLVTRTFSKAYALAGLRCGYGLGHPDIMKRMSRFGCGPTSTNMAGFGAAGASLGDRDHVERSRKFVRDSRAFYETHLQRLEIPYVSGPANFILAELGDKAASVTEELRRRNVFVRFGEEWGLPQHVRISYGLGEENEAFFRELASII